MIEQTLDIATKDGAMETFICHPERGGPYPAVLLLMDALGIREELRDMARRLGTVGYYVLLPNLYYRAGRDTIYGPDVLTHGSAEHARMRAVRTKMTIPPVMDDVGDARASSTSRRRRKPARSGRMAIAGGLTPAGRGAFSRACCRASFYGTWLVNDAEESPHLSLGRSGASSTSPAPSMTSSRRCRWSNCAACFAAPAPPAKSRCTRASITASPSQSAGATTSQPPSAIGSA
jgi:carboxymethylenebutenolidase